MLYAEGETAPKMMSVGLHCRLVGRPGRIAALGRFIDYALQHPKVWVCRRIDIARHWRERHPYHPATPLMSHDKQRSLAMSRAIDLPDFARLWVDLAQPRLGGAAIHATDEFFAPKERMLDPAPAVFIPGKYDDNGKWMDGWESRRKRGEGHDHCIVRLGRPGVIKGVDIDTSHFTGNYPAGRLAGGLPQRRRSRSRRRNGPRSCRHQSHRQFPSLPGRRQTIAIWTHVRLNIYPDGGVARLRVYGQVHCDWSKADRKGSWSIWRRWRTAVARSPATTSITARRRT